MGKRFAAVAGMEMKASFWRGKKVFLTGHTGFKGSWMSLLLGQLGAEVIGYALTPPTTPSIFELGRLDKLMTSVCGDVRDLGQLQETLDRIQPEIVIHMAAQSLVRSAYRDPVETYSTNVMGTVNVLEATRHCDSIRTTLIVTSDKCYDNRNQTRQYRQDDPMGGPDPYSSSKGCAELVTRAYRDSYFAGGQENGPAKGVASVRAGNVIGGGDWAEDRLIPDCIRAFTGRQPVKIRNPRFVRPWQFVLEPLVGYLTLIEHLHQAPQEYAGGWNFGPDDSDAWAVDKVVQNLVELWGDGATWESDGDKHPHEVQTLRLDCSTAHSRLGWSPRTNLRQTLTWIVQWYRGWTAGEDVVKLCSKQIADFMALKGYVNERSPMSVLRR